MQDKRSARERRPSRPLEGGPTAGTCVLLVDSWCLVYDADGREEMPFEVSLQEVSFATKRHKLDPAAHGDCALKWNLLILFNPHSFLCSSSTLECLRARQFPLHLMVSE